MVATSGLELEYVIDPVLLLEGSTNVKDSFPNIFVGIVKLVIIGTPLFTTNVAVIVPDMKLALLACVAVITVVPIPTIVIVSLEIVATSVFELLYVKLAGLLDVGLTILKDAFPICFSGREKLLRIGVALPTTNCVVIMADVLLNVLSWNSVIVVFPTPTIVIMSPKPLATNGFDDL
jgi:hypothetical protein